jgi:hypothetical protein
MTPTVLKIGQFRFHFYSDEGNEPPHIHVSTNDGECKFWLKPIKLASNKYLASHVVNKIEKLIYENHEFLIKEYEKFHQ